MQEATRNRERRGQFPNDSDLSPIVRSVKSLYARATHTAPILVRRPHAGRVSIDSRSATYPIVVFHGGWQVAAFDLRICH